MDRGQTNRPRPSPGEPGANTRSNATCARISTADRPASERVRLAPRFESHPSSSSTSCGRAADDVTDPVGALRGRRSRHESFLIYARFRYLKIACAAAVVSIVLYLVDSPYPSRYGGSWVGYTLGSAGAFLILWLMWFGYRKRSYLKNQGNLVAWLSAHVYLGLSLLVIATLHTGFHFGWNIHTLAYVLMCLVILSGAFGVLCYVRYPRLMTDNRRGTAMPQMLGRIAGLDDELRTAAIGVDNRTAVLVERAVGVTAIGGSLRQQLSGRYPHCTTAAALASIGEPAS